MAEALHIARGLPRYAKPPVLHEGDWQSAAFTNQFGLDGIDVQFPNPFVNTDKIVVFLEAVQATGTFDIQDREGTVVFGAITDFQMYPGIRLDGGFKLVGTILLAKGYFHITK